MAASADGRASPSLLRRRFSEAAQQSKMQRRLSDGVAEIYAALGVPTAGTRISAAELREGLERLKLPCSDEIVEQIFAEADGNGDGYLDYAKLLVYVRQREEEIAATFARSFGTRGVGPDEISFDQLKQALVGLGVKATDRQIAAFLTHLDQDDTGTVSLAEFTSFVYLLPRVDVGVAFESWLANHVGGLDVGAEPGQVESSTLLPNTSTKASEGAVFIAGACAGVVSRTATAPLDRVKMLMQVDVSDGYSAEKAKKRAARAAAAAEAAVAAGAAGGEKGGSVAGGGSRSSSGSGSSSSSNGGARGASKPPPPVSRVRPDGVISGLRGMYREGGVMAFYQGNTANVIKVMREPAWHGPARHGPARHGPACLGQPAPPRVAPTLHLLP
jgi:Ca2+-binding EF-hand superfamily protein